MLASLQPSILEKRMVFARRCARLARPLTGENAMISDRRFFCKTECLVDTSNSTEVRTEAAETKQSREKRADIKMLSVMCVCACMTPESEEWGPHVGGNVSGQDYCCCCCSCCCCCGCCCCCSCCDTPVPLPLLLFHYYRFSSCFSTTAAAAPL